MIVCKWLPVLIACTALSLNAAPLPDNSWDMESFEPEKSSIPPSAGQDKDNTAEKGKKPGKRIIHKPKRPSLPKEAIREKLENIPAICARECEENDQHWLGKVIVDGKHRSIDFLRANIDDIFGLNYSCTCKNVWNSSNNDPIWSHTHALMVCKERCQDDDGEWTGHWWTTIWQKHSVCQCMK